MALLQGIANTTSNPAAVGEGVTTPSALRTGKTNELYVGSMVPTKHLSALAGNYYTFAQTSGIAVVTSLTSLTEASPALIIENTDAVGGKNILLDFVRIDATAIAAAAVDWQYTWKLDNIRNKWASAGTTLTPQNASMGTSNVSVGTVHAGALVVSSAQQSSTNARTIAGGFLTPTGTAPVQIIGDMVDFRFGALEAPLPTVRSNVASNGAHTFAMCLCVPIAPVVLTPGTTATLFLYATTAGSAASYTFTGGWYEY